MPSRKRKGRSPGAVAAVASRQDAAAHGVWRVSDEATVDRLVAMLFDADRSWPVVVVTTPTDTLRPRLRVADLAALLGDSTDVAVLDHPRVALHLSSRVPDHLRVYGGAIRVWLPYARPDDAGDRHPLFITRNEAQGPRTIEWIHEHLERLGFVSPANTGHEKTATGPVPAQPRTSPAEAIVEVADAAARRREADLRAQVEDLRSRLRQVTEENAGLRRELRSSADRIEHLEQRLHQRDVYSDPEAQFRHEVQVAWLLGYSEPDRETYRLRSYTLGPDFLSSVQDVEGIARSQVVSGCVDVLTRRVFELNSRQAHPFRESSAGNAPQRTRADGATAWRAYLQANTPSARRLMWWEQVDGTVELARVSVHDDFTELR